MAQDICDIILFRVMTRMKERYVWLKINEEEEAMECLSVEYWLAKQADNAERIIEILTLVHMLNDKARDLFFKYADNLALEYLKEEWDRYERER